MTQAPALQEAPAPAADGDRVEMLLEFHDQVRGLMASVHTAETDLHRAEDLVKDRKASVKELRADLEAYINDQHLPLLDGGVGD